VSRLGSDAVFRFNVDLWRDYSIDIDACGFTLANPAGRTVTEETLAKVYWRKPQVSADLYPEKSFSKEEQYFQGEIWYALRELVNLQWALGKVVLVEPGAESRVGKLVQLRASEGLFETPAWRFARGVQFPATAGAVSVAKSFTLGRVGAAKALYATKVDASKLDAAAPWFVTEYVPAILDVTVVFVRGALFAFEFPRALFLDKAIDWRLVALEEDVNWRPHEMQGEFGDKIRQLMGRLTLDYGRLDFLLTDSGKYVFLEVNPNGEWGWLDKAGAHGVLNRILDEVSPDTSPHPLPAALRPISAFSL
jgi:hypothetical protein